VISFLRRLMGTSQLSWALSGQESLQRDLLAWRTLTPLSTSYAPWTEGSLAPRALVAILNEVVLHGRQSVVECGSGTSTLFIGRLLRMLGVGRLLAIEHSEEWATWLRRQLAIEGLDQYVDLVLAPLVPTKRGWDETALWYNEMILKDATRGSKFDLVIIDGPPADEEPLSHSRFPALSFFLTLLTEDACVILDNVEREGEKDILARWERDTCLRFLLRSDLGIGVAYVNPESSHAIL
jgi:predicted O-methyltransferase YrrM